MRHKLFALLALALLSGLFVVVGVLALLDVPNVTVGFWDRSAIESRAGKIAWIAISATCFVIFLRSAVREYRRGGDGPSPSPDV